MMLILLGNTCNIIGHTIPGRVACLDGGGVKTDAGPGVFRGCLATWRADITTAWDPWYLQVFRLV